LFLDQILWLPNPVQDFNRFCYFTQKHEITQWSQIHDGAANGRQPLGVGELAHSEPKEHFQLVQEKHLPKDAKETEKYEYVANEKEELYEHDDVLIPAFTAEYEILKG
jgi:hypothetical protein